jgi:UDP:flavonoid glycosyltransferase YjiC (YdhE family)
VITHAGLNTALESLAHGVPMVAIPIANDQPGVAARLVRLGVAELVPLRELNEQSTHSAVTKVLADPAYRQAAHEWQRKIAEGQGLQRAAEIVEQALTGGKRITNDVGLRKLVATECLSANADRSD